MSNYVVINNQTNQIVKTYPDNSTLELQDKYRKLAKRYWDTNDLEYGAVKYKVITMN